MHANKAVWLKFVEENIIPDHVDAAVVEGWKRSKAYGVDPYGGLGKGVEPEAFQRALEDNREMLNIARPMMENLHEIVLGSHYALVLTDKHGRILESIGDKVVNEEVKQMRYVVGALWSEEIVGSNAIGTALAVDGPVRFVGEDHFCITHHGWCCAAMTIHDHKGNTIGCLNMSGKRERVNPHTLGIVVAAVYTIEREMALNRSHRLLEATFESTSDGMLIINKDFKIVKANHHASRILTMPAETMIQADIRKIFVDLDFEIGEEDYSHKSNLFFADSVANVEGRRIHCAVNLVPIANENGMAGFHISFSKSKELHRKVNKVAGNMAIYQFEDIIGESKSLQKVIASARKIAKTRSNVLIEGESGTGKELFAQSIHNHSSRKAGPFVAINCASLPRELIESELFGYEKGAFTGALKDGKIGKFELAEGGTIFLDEIGELPIEVQAKLLRVLDNFTIRRIGSNYEKKLDVRIIAATNRDLLAEVEKKNFRHDLYYRLNVFKLELPALRDRENDVEICAKYFLAKLNDQNRYGVKIFSSGFYQAIRSYKWVGNIRELQNIVERAYYLCEGKLITPEHLPDSIVDHQEVRSQASYHEEPGQDRSWILDVKNVERNNIVNMLIQCDKNVLEAAKQLSISKSTIYRKISKYGIDLKKL